MVSLALKVRLRLELQNVLFLLPVYKNIGMIYFSILKMIQGRAVGTGNTENFQ